MAQEFHASCVPLPADYSNASSLCVAMGCSQGSKSAGPPEEVKADRSPEPDSAQAAKEEGLKPGSKVYVSKDGGFQGEVLRCTTTNVLVRGPDGKEIWYEIEEIEDARAAPCTPGLPLQTEVQVGRKVSTARGVSGTVTKRTTTEVCIRTEAGEEIFVAIEDVTYLSLCIQAASGLRNADYIGKSDPYCICRLEGKPESKLETSTISGCLDPLWNFEARLVSYERGDTLSFEVYDKDDILGRAKLTSNQFEGNRFFGDLQLEDDNGNVTKATLRLQVCLMNADADGAQPEAEPTTAGRDVQVEEESPAPQSKKACGCF
uniref:C2 domain-containing protein n=1 Tax=Alexandrium catenella TaxID=2925 RepID=A0A7S1SF68_ALECA